ncbi:hypothetical protein PV10_03447 [Exophiala mesophila]|uniref:Uncharacterized protein n=1 Tax=Exophiala mesophila TaxID=212818 RepID=A0A0D1Y571_EXOME|nr:uncharacterized protein PV10_03447 [Exophiala mesophila]KIV95841.1 hypothetical protein PV10_03447 [Exophiala mesophila]
MSPPPPDPHPHQPERPAESQGDYHIHPSAEMIFHAILDYRSLRSGLRIPPRDPVPGTAPLAQNEENISGDPPYQGTSIRMMQPRTFPEDSYSLSPRRDVSQNAALAESQAISTGPTQHCSPFQLARQFAESVSSDLTAQECGLLLTFLTETRMVNESDTKVLLQSRLDEFYQAETALTGEPRDRLSTPSGPVDAALGIVLHCQSKRGPVGEFWDPESPTIQALLAKGLNSDFVFGFDWHWRAEETARRPGRSTCPTRVWASEKRLLHDKLSSDILNILDLPWLIVGGSCAKSSYQRTLLPTSRLTTLSLSSTINIEIELEFGTDHLRRITLYIPHPSSGFFHPSYASTYATILDAGISFFLWIQCKDDRVGFFTATKSVTLRGIPGAAPLQELYQYRQREEVLGRALTENEYQATFLIWAANYLSQRPSTILDCGDSLADALIRKIGSAIRAKHESNGHNYTSAGRKGPAARYGYSFKQYWDGERVSVTQKGTFKIFLSADQPSLELRGGRPLVRLISKSPEHVTIHFSAQLVTLKQDGQVVFQKACDRIEDADQRKRWTEQVKVECSRNAISASTKQANS